ncbi:thioredoxin family protein [Shewanella maritima]|uniref:Thioredoxin family protein n=1 Tax=Shewanella maritima TaxID=2520507 RepID=A0A411PG70_9GAMM|nr:thioredoxin family protein [Shewanella maritima]QBF82596.1 thioredoxin family protein [Shewanella maritima]
MKLVALRHLSLKPFKSKAVAVGLVLMSILALSACSSNQHSKEHHSDHSLPTTLDKYQFTANNNYLADIDAAKQQAIESNKLLMLVMGAQWCHDSRGFIANLSSDEMQAIVAQRFVVELVDVAYFDDLHHVAQQYGYPAIFGTPTVLVIEPKTNKVLNYNSVSKWQSAHSVPQAEYVSYFASIGDAPWQAPTTNAQFDEFIAQQTDKLKQAYDYQRPIWAQVRAGKADDKQLTKVATEVWKYRVQLQKDIYRLQAELAANPNKELVLPQYPAFSWL